jgi:hypothetical protein
MDLGSDETPSFKQEKRTSQPESRLAPEVSDGGRGSHTPLDGCNETSNVGSWQQWSRWMWKHPRLHIALLEFRSFLRRIQIVCSTSEMELPRKDFVWLQDDDGCLHLNTRSCDRNENIQMLASSHDWATPLDWALWQQSWDQGAEWAIRTFYSDSPSTNVHKALLASELAYVPPSRKWTEAQKSPKYDPSNQLP